MAKQTNAADVQAQQPNEQAQDILLLHDKVDKVLQAITNLDKDGKHETKPFDQAETGENNSFLKVDKQGNWLENFWKNLVSQFKDPTKFNLISIREGDLDDPKVKKALADIAAGKNTKAAKEFLEKYEIRAKSPEQAAEARIDWDALAKMGITREGLEKSGMLDAFLKQAAGEPVKMQEATPQQYRFNESLVNWKQLDEMGISKEMLIQRGLLDQLLKGYKTNQLVPLSINTGAAYIRMEARLSLMPDQEGLRLYINGVRQAPDLDRSYMGHVFSDEDKRNLRETGNMGRSVELRGRDGQYHEALVSIDKLTNELVAVKKENVFIPEEIRGVKLTPDEIADLKDGKEIYLEGMLSNAGREFNAYVQYNADRRGVEYRFENERLFNAQTLGGAKISEQQRDAINAGKAVLVENMQGRNGEFYDRYVKLDEATGNLSFLKYNPDSPEDARQVIIPKELGGVKLTAEDRKTLAEGKPVYIEDMQMRNGNEESRFVKVDLRTGNLSYARTEFGFDERQAFKVPQEIRGAALSASQRAQLQDGKAVLVDGIQGHDGKTISQWVRVSRDQSRLEMYNDNPDRRRDASQRNVVAERNHQSQDGAKKGRGVQ